MNAELDRVLNDTFDLYIELGATDAEFPVVYAVATTGRAADTRPRSGPRALFDTILQEVFLSKSGPGCASPGSRYHAGL